VSLSINKEGSLYGHIDRLFESAFVFNANQILLDGGKTRQIKRFLRDLEFETVVDIGCGPGNWAKVAPGDYLGVDTSPSFIETCERRYRKDPRKRFIRADATTLDVHDPFDLAMLISVLHHLSDEQVLRLCRWVAASADYFFVLDLYPNPRNPVSRFLYAMDRGNFIREPGEQEALINRDGLFEVVRKNDYFCPNRFYRHTLFLLKTRRDPEVRQVINSRGPA
jgi:SAM-dependent methyltransferase